MLEWLVKIALIIVLSGIGLMVISESYIYNKSKYDFRKKS